MIAYQLAIWPIFTGGDVDQVVAMLIYATFCILATFYKLIGIKYLVLVSRACLIDANPPSQHKALHNTHSSMSDRSIHCGSVCIQPGENTACIHAAEFEIYTFIRITESCKHLQLKSRTGEIA